MEPMTVGAIAAGYAVAGLFFLRFWRDSRDRLFALFALAFFVLAINRVVAGMLAEPDRDPVYWVRFAAYAVILMAILDKNRSGGGGRRRVSDPLV
jgi:hypothetical protein